MDLAMDKRPNNFNLNSTHAHILSPYFVVPITNLNSSSIHNTNPNINMCLRMWAELPGDIVESISKKLTSHADYLRFRSVCRRWRICTPRSPLHLPTQFPWLMLNYKSYFDLSTNKIHNLNLAPYPSGLSYIYGSSHGWLVIIDKISEIRLVNPFTLSTISLPRFNFHNDRRCIFVIKIILSSSPSLSDDFSAFALLEISRFAFYKKGYDSWVVLELNKNTNWVDEWVDVAYKNGCFYIVNTNGMIAVFDVARFEISHIEMTGVPCAKADCYVLFLEEDMLFIRKIISKADQKLRFKIYKSNCTMRKWEQIQSLGEHSLFIETKSSLCCCASDFVGYRPNCIYYTDPICGIVSYVGIYSLSDESISIDRLPSNSPRSRKYTIWFKPSP